MIAQILKIRSNRTLRFCSFLCLGLVAGLIFSSLVFASPKFNLVDLPDEIIDLGKIKEGRVEEGSLVIKNSGDEPLRLSSIQPSCSCIEIITPQNKLIIAPGQKGKIVFSFNSTGYSGKTIQYLYLESNDPSHRALSIKITADVFGAASSFQNRFSKFSSFFIMSMGLIDGINPCAFTVIVFFMSFLLFVGYSRRDMLIVGSAFILAVFLTYFLIGLGIFGAFKHLGIFVRLSRLLYLFTAAVAFILGSLSLYDFWRYKKSGDTDKVILKLPSFLKKMITRAINKGLDRRRKVFKNTASLIAAAFSCGVIVSFLESACTGQMYLPTIIFMLKHSSLKLQAFLFLFAYNIMFILPLIAVFLFAVFGVSSAVFSRLVQRYLAGVKLATAILFFLLAALLLFM